MMLEMNVNKVCACQAPKSLRGGVFQRDPACSKMANASVCQWRWISGPSNFLLEACF